MPRNNTKGVRTKLQHPMSFRKMCRLVGIKPLQRVKLMKLLNENLKQSEEVDRT